MVKISEPPLYPNLEEEQQVDKGENFRLKRISDMREFLEKEVETRGRRRYKPINNTAIIIL